MAKKICLDAGHYGKYNRSPAVPEYYESDMNWKLHNMLKAELEAYGFVVIQTRSDKAKDKGLETRGKASKGCDLFLSIHSNAVGSSKNETIDHPIVIVQADGRGDKLGRLLTDCIAATMGTKEKGRVGTKKNGKGGEWYGVLRGAAAVGTVGMIMEHSFHTHTKMTKWLLNDSNLAKMAKAEAKIIAEYFGMGKKEESTSTSTETKGAATVDIEMNVLKKGAKGEQVKTLQRLLLALGYKMTDNNGKEYGADGSFGGATDKAVRKYQKDKGLEVDGSVGRATWTKLLKG